MNDERDPDSVVDDEGNVLGYRCPACETIVTSEAKAHEHCSSPDPTPDSPNTTTDSQPDDRSRDANPGCGAAGSPPRETDDGRGPDYSEVVERSWPAGVRDRAHWMPTDGKMPFAKYADHPAIDYYRDPACDVTDSDPRRSWSDPSNWRDFETVDEWVQMDPTLAGQAFIMQREGDPYARSGETDPYLFIDGDKIRDPDTGEVIPEFPAAVDRLTGGKPTFQEVSSSDTGAHGPRRGRAHRCPNSKLLGRSVCHR